MTFQFIIKTLASSSVFLLTLGCSSETKKFDHPQTPVKAQVLQTGLTQSPVQVGDIFVFDNPQTNWEVIGTSNDTIQWRDGENGYMKTSFSTLLPKLRWSSNGDAGSRSVIINSGYLHPLKEGNQIAFTENTVRARPGSTYQAQWECHVEKQVEIVVTAGKSMTWPVLCTVNGVEKVLFNYSENIGHVVRYIVANDDGSKFVRQLTNYIRGPESDK